MDRLSLSDVLERLEPGDVLVIHELDRLGRSMVQVLQVTEALMECGIGLVGVSHQADHLSSGLTV